MIPTLLSAFASACLLVGMGLSIAAWVVIARSGGKLGGRRLAIFGTFAPVGLWVVGQLLGAALLSFRFVG